MERRLPASKSEGMLERTRLRQTKLAAALRESLKFKVQSLKRIVMERRLPASKSEGRLERTRLRQTKLALALARKFKV